VVASIDRDMRAVISCVRDSRASAEGDKADSEVKEVCEPYRDIGVEAG